MDKNVDKRLNKQQSRYNAQTCADLPLHWQVDAANFDVFRRIIQNAIAHLIVGVEMPLCAIQLICWLPISLSFGNSTNSDQTQQNFVAKNARLLAKSLLPAALASPQRLDHHCECEKTMVTNVLEYLAR